MKHKSRHKQEIHYFYVLLCADQSYYAGYTNHLQRRIAKHNAKKGAKYTRVHQRHPLKLQYYACFSSKSEALKAEYAFKQLTRKQKEAFFNITTH